MKKFFTVALISGGLALIAATPANATTYLGDTLALLAAGERASVIAETTGNNTTTNNGSEWYFQPESSMGFAVQGATVELDSADTNGGADEWSRLSWHLRPFNDTDYVGDGYRLGDNYDLNRAPIEAFDNEEEYLAQPAFTTGRFIFTADTLPGYYPSGPQQNVSVNDLDGWTLCWSNLYGDQDPAESNLEDIFNVCDGAYLMLAGGEIGAGDLDSSSGKGLATTGGDSGWILGFASAFIAAGMIVAIRRQRA